MSTETHSKSRLKPRLALRVGGLGNRKFGTENNIEGESGPMKDEASIACQAVFAVIVKTLRHILHEDRAETNVIHPMENEGRYWWMSKLGLLFGRVDRWRRLSPTAQKQPEAKSKREPAPVFSHERPYLRVFTGDAEGGDEIIARTAGMLRDQELELEVGVPLGPDVELVVRAEAERKSPVLVECLPITVKKPAEEPKGLGIGSIPKSTQGSQPSPLSRTDARNLTSIARQRAHGFRAQSEALRHHSDILIAIWDEDAEGKAGGTSESVELALREHIPVVAIRFPEGKAQISVLTSPEEMRCGCCNDWADTLRSTLEELLCFPEEPAEEEHETSYGARVAYASFVGDEPFRAIWVGRFWKALDRWMKGSIGLGSLLWEWVKAPLPLLGLPSLILEEWTRSNAQPEKHAGLEKSAAAAPQPQTFKHYYAPAKDRASKMSGVFGDAHRGGIVASYLLAAGAVFLALIGGICHYHEAPHLVIASIAVAEFFLIVLLFALAKVSSLEDWNEAYTDSRVLAEALRAMQYLGPLGVHLPLPRLPRHLSGDKKWPTMWTRWYFRALVRQAPLRVDVEKAVDLQSYRAKLMKDWIGGGESGGENENSQHAHHEKNVRAQYRLEQGIEHFGIWLFRIVVLAALLHTILACFECACEEQKKHDCSEAHPAKDVSKQVLDTTLFLLCVGGPTTLAALQGLLSQLEARRLRKRSESMIANFAQRREALRNLILTDPDTHELSDSAEAVWGLTKEAHGIAMEMVDEVSGWSLIYKNTGIHAG